MWEKLSTEMKHAPALDDTTMETGSDDTTLAPAPPVHRLHYGAGAGALQRRHGGGAACAGASVGVPAGAGEIAVQSVPPGATPAGGGPDLRRACERSGRGGHGRDEPHLRCGAACHLRCRPRSSRRSPGSGRRGGAATGIVDENNASCTSYAPPTNHQAARWDNDIAGATISIVDLTSTGDG